MNTFTIGLRENRTAFKQGETIEGAAHWELETAPKSAEVRLLWFTRGKGTEDVEVVEAARFDAPAAGDVREFRFTLPNAPYTFSGRLISLIWAVELLVQPGNKAARVEFTMAPGGKEVLIAAHS